jgi:hypothetical protein
MSDESKIIEIPKRPPICPVLSGAQIVPYGMALKGEAVPISPISLASLKAGSFGGPQPPSGAFAVQVAGGYNYKFKQEEGKPAPGPNDPPPPPVGDSISVPCVGPPCGWWSETHAACGGPPGLLSEIATLKNALSGGEVALASARALLNKAHENYDQDNSEEEDR